MKHEMLTAGLTYCIRRLGLKWQKTCCCCAATSLSVLRCAALLLYVQPLLAVTPHPSKADAAETVFNCFCAGVPTPPSLSLSLLAASPPCNDIQSWRGLRTVHLSLCLHWLGMIVTFLVCRVVLEPLPAKWAGVLQGLNDMAMETLQAYVSRCGFSTVAAMSLTCKP